MRQDWKNWTGADVKAWRVRVGKRLTGKKLTQQQASALIGIGEAGTTLRGWENGGNPVPRMSTLAMIAVDAATWCESEEFPAPPALRALVDQD